MSYARTTFTTLKDRLAKRVGGQGKFWTNRELGNALNEALAVWQCLTGEFVVVGTFSGAGNLVEVFDPTGVSATDLATDTLNLIRLQVNGAGSFMYPVSIDDLDLGKYGWRNEAAGTPTYWAPYGLSHVVVHPDAAGSTTFSATYYRGDKILQNDSDYVNLGDEELVRLVDYAQWYLSFKESPKEGLENTGPLKELFFLAARTRNAKLAGSALYERFAALDRSASASSAAPTEGLKEG